MRRAVKACILRTALDGAMAQRRVTLSPRRAAVHRRAYAAPHLARCIHKRLALLFDGADAPNAAQSLGEGSRRADRGRSLPAARYRTNTTYGGSLRCRSLAGQRRSSQRLLGPLPPRCAALAAAQSGCSGRERGQRIPPSRLGGVGGPAAALDASAPLAALRRSGALWHHAALPPQPAPPAPRPSQA